MTAKKTKERTDATQAERWVDRAPLHATLACGGDCAGEVARAAIGGAVGVAGGVEVTLAAMAVRARFQNEYLNARPDLIHWQTTSMITAPAAGAVLGWAGADEHALRSRAAP